MSQQQSVPLDIPVEGFPISKWCASAGVSAALYFKQRRAGRGPRFMKLGRRVVIVESPREYTARLEAERQAAE